MKSTSINIIRQKCYKNITIMLQIYYIFKKIKKTLDKNKKT